MESLVRRPSTGLIVAQLVLGILATAIGVISAQGIPLGAYILLLVLPGAIGFMVTINHKYRPFSIALALIPFGVQLYAFGLMSFFAYAHWFPINEITTSFYMFPIGLPVLVACCLRPFATGLFGQRSQ